MSQPQQETTAPPAKARGKAPLLIAAGTVALLAGVGVVMFSGGGGKVPEAGAADEPAPADKGATTVISLAPFILNLADLEDERYLRLNVSIVLIGEEGAKPETEEGPEHALLRDCILTVLGSMQSEDVLSFEGKEALRQELKRHVALLLPDQEVVDVLFTEFLVQ